MNDEIAVHLLASQIYEGRNNLCFNENHKLSFQVHQRA